MAWGFLLFAALSAIPAYVWTNVALWIRALSCEHGRCETGAPATGQVVLAIAAITAWMLALIAGWLRFEWTFVVLACVSAVPAVAWLPVAL